MRVMVIEQRSDVLVDARYEETIMKGAHNLKHWGDIDISREDYERFVRLQKELYELTEELKGND